MNTDFIKHLFDAIKMAPRYLVAIALVLAFLLFAPNEIAQRLGVADMAKDYRQWFGVAFLACVALLSVSVFQAGYGVVRTMVAKRRFKRQMRERLGRLTEDEKQILRFYIGRQTRSNTLRADDGVVQCLAQAHIIFRAASLGSLVEGFAYNINEIAWDVLNEEPDFLNGETDTYRTDKLSYRG
ncbi:MAG: superinfection exclusion B family protein [Rhodoferax sp.]